MESAAGWERWCWDWRAGRQGVRNALDVGSRENSKKTLECSAGPCNLLLAMVYCVALCFFSHKVRAREGLRGGWRLLA